MKYSASDVAAVLDGLGVEEAQVGDTRLSAGIPSISKHTIPAESSLSIGVWRRTCFIARRPSFICVLSS